MSVENFPAELRVLQQFVHWRVEYRNDKQGNPKPTKVPYRPDAPGVRADTTKAETWGTFEQARAAADDDRIGFVFSADDPLCGVDLDDCVDAETGELHAKAIEIVERLGGYAEWSPSGRGLHIIVRGELHTDRHKTRKTPWRGDFEIYDCDRFFTVTGNVFGEYKPPADADVTQLAAEMFPKSQKAASGSSNGWAPLSLTDEELLERAFAARNGPKLRALYYSAGREDEDESASDLSLCNLLAFWSGPDPDRLERLMRGSSRMRDKWDERRGDSTWIAGRIAKALADRRDFYTPRGASSNGHGPTANKEADDAGGGATWERISRRYGIASDPIERGETLQIDTRTGNASVRLCRRSGKEIRFESIADLWFPAKHHRLVTLQTLVTMKMLSGPDAAEIASSIAELCGGSALDPLEDTRASVEEFIASAAREIDADEMDDLEAMAELKRAERARDAGDRADRRPILLVRNGELWLPAGALQAFADSGLRSWQFDGRMLELGWRKEEVEVRPSTRAERATPGSHVRRRFYVAAA